MGATGNRRSSLKLAVPAKTAPFHGSPQTAYLVRRANGEYGPVYPLDNNRRQSIGRANTNAIVLPDDGCSRNHAEIVWTGAEWFLRDLGSLNGTLVNGKRIDQGCALQPDDRVNIAQTELLFVHDLESLDVQTVSDHLQVRKGLAIKHRQNQTQLLDVAASDALRSRFSRDLQTLYALGLTLGRLSDPAELAAAVIRSLLQATGADSGAVLGFEPGGAPTVIASQSPAERPYRSLSDDAITLVTGDREAILADDIGASFDDPAILEKHSMVCAPVVHESRLVALLHVYSTNPLKSLANEDLELAVAVSQQLGPVWTGLNRQIRLSDVNQQLRESLRVDSELIGESDVMRAVHQRIAQVAPSNATVLVRGESGVGKELVARAIHFSSERRDGPFVCLNCAALPETLLENELFGHEKGAYTGATEQKKGKFELAHGGTIFLDEIGEMALATQAKLLRVLDGYAFERVGGDLPIRVNVRVVAATNSDLERVVSEGKFRSDLYYRLQVVEVQVPPLRARRQDVPILARFFLDRFGRDLGKRFKGFSSEAVAKLSAYDWPGNVRELRNVVERAVVLSGNSALQPDDVLLTTPIPPREASAPVFLPRSLETIEAEYIQKTLEHTRGNKSHAASILGIERSTLDRKIKKYKLAEPK